MVIELSQKEIILQEKKKKKTKIISSSLSHLITVLDTLFKRLYKGGINLINKKFGRCFIKKSS